MRILLIGGTGTIGRSVAAALSTHTVLIATRSSATLPVDIAEPESIRRLLNKVGMVDAIISVAGAASFKPLATLTDDDFAFSVADKLMGQVNLVRYGLPHVHTGGSITLTSGILAHEPIPGGAAFSLVNAALEGFARVAALEAPRNIRVNVVSPPWLISTLEALGMPTTGGLPAEEVATAFVRSVEGADNGRILTLAR